MVVDRLSKEVDNALFTRGTVDRANVLLGEHGIILVRSCLLVGVDKLVQVFDLYIKPSAIMSKNKI